MKRKSSGGPPPPHAAAAAIQEQRRRSSGAPPSQQTSSAHGVAAPSPITSPEGVRPFFSYKLTINRVGISYAEVIRNLISVKSR